MLVSIEQLERSNKRFKGWKDSDSKNNISDSVTRTSAQAGPIPPEISKNNIIGDAANLQKRKQNIQRVGIEPANFAYERAIGKNDAVYSNFVDLLYEAKRKVGRIVIKRGSENLGYATGFMISPTLLITNWHVFPEKYNVEDSVVQFDYELDMHGNPKDAIVFKLDAEKFFYSFRALDYCLIAVAKQDTSQEHFLKEIGCIHLDPTVGKLGNLGEERLNIIHHPGGEHKQLSIRENKFTKITSTTIWYKSDTAQGSSGAPVFNDQWQLVGLHHSGIPLKNEFGEYLDKEDKVIPVENGKIDESKVCWLANEGIRISVIRRHLTATFPNEPLIGEVLNQDPILQGNHTRPDHSAKAEKNEPVLNSQEAINISIPSSLLERQRNISFNINTNQFSPSNKEEDDIQLQFSGFDDNTAIETLKLERSMDYTMCRGYRSDFLGDDLRVPIPKPQRAIKKYIAKLKGSKRASILKYYKYSVIFHELRRMPLISAINVDGDLDKRQDHTKRKDKWIRDTRLDLEIQLNDKFYKKSGFDRGHMSRREDANWGETPEDAKRNADLTCMHTNACPQVPAINRSNKKGLWGSLEKVILEKGATREEGKIGKISVFSGPIFKESDPVYKGVQIPMEFYKIVLWLNDAKELQATGFKLSQRELIGDIDFEDIGINRNIVFKPYQCSIQSLQMMCSIDFSDLFDYDTFHHDYDREVVDENHLAEILNNTHRDIFGA